METLILFSLLISAVVFGILGTVIAQNKGVSRTAGFWWGFLLGPVGLIVVALLNPEPQASISIRTSDRFSAVDGVEYDTSNDSYRLWLVRKYGIEKNDTLGKFIVGTSVLNDLEEALSFADNLERADIEAKKQSRVAEERAQAEAEVILQSQVEANKASFKKIVSRIRKFSPIIVAVCLVVVVAVTFGIASGEFEKRKRFEDTKQSYESSRSKFAFELRKFGVDVSKYSTGDKNHDESYYLKNSFNVANSYTCSYDTVDYYNYMNSRIYERKPIDTNGVLFTQVVNPFNDSTPEVHYHYLKELVEAGFEKSRDVRGQTIFNFNENTLFNYKTKTVAKISIVHSGESYIFGICFGKFSL